MDIQKELKVVASIEIITAIALILAWLIYFTLYDSMVFFPFDKLAYQKGLPLFDVPFAGLLIYAGTQLFKGKPSGKTISFICAAYMIFFGVTDYGINFQGESYALSIIDMLAKGFVNLWCIILGIFI